MITEQDWKEFQEFRGEKMRERFEYVWNNLPKMKPRPTKWYKRIFYNSSSDLTEYFQDLEYNGIVADSFHPVPPETIEACLNWKMRRDK